MSKRIPKTEVVKQALDSARIPTKSAQAALNHIRVILRELSQEDKLEVASNLVSVDWDSYDNGLKWDDYQAGVTIRPSFDGLQLPEIDTGFV